MRLLISLLVFALLLSSCASSGGTYESEGSSTSGSSQQAQVCPSCDGSGTCNMCYGDGINPLDSNRRLPCTACGGGGRCRRCRGTGSI